MTCNLDQISLFENEDNILLNAILLILVDIRSNMDINVAKRWKEDIFFEPLWKLYSFDRISTLASGGCMMASRYAQKGVLPLSMLSEEAKIKMKQEFLTKFHAFRVNHPNFIEITMETPLELMEEYDRQIKECLEEENYNSWKEMFITSGMVSQQLLKKFLSPEKYERLREDPDLKLLLEMIGCRK